LEELEGKDCYITEKLEGCSLTVFYKEGVFGVCSRNMELKEEDTAYWNTVKSYKLKEVLEKVGKNIALQGELIGPKIQENIYNLNQYQYKVFNVFDIDNQRYLDFEEFLTFTEQNKIETVPILVKSFSLISDVGELLKLAEIKSQLNASTDAEGIVIRPKKELWHRKLGRVSFKAISNKYLLKASKT
jgi:RNA ligase (TIGR02306 family)